MPRFVKAGAIDHDTGAAVFLAANFDSELNFGALAEIPLGVKSDTAFAPLDFFSRAIRGIREINSYGTSIVCET